MALGIWTSPKSEYWDLRVCFWNFVGLPKWAGALKLNPSDRNGVDLMAVLNVICRSVSFKGIYTVLAWLLLLLIRLGLVVAK